MDIGQNQRGVYVRVTEQTRYFRAAITGSFVISFYDRYNISLQYV